MLLKAVRTSKRERYEVILIKALTALGFEASLSTDEEDLFAGIDAWIQYQGSVVPVDFFSGCDRSTNLINKLASASCKGILVLSLKRDLIDELLSGDQKRMATALLEIRRKTQRTLSGARFQKLVTKQKVQKQVDSHMRILYWQRSWLVELVA